MLQAIHTADVMSVTVHLLLCAVTCYQAASGRFDATQEPLMDEATLRRKLRDYRGPKSHLL
jgi:hypothetical protein